MEINFTCRPSGFGLSIFKYLLASTLTGTFSKVTVGVPENGASFNTTSSSTSSFSTDDPFFRFGGTGEFEIYKKHNIEAINKAKTFILISTYIFNR